MVHKEPMEFRARVVHKEPRVHRVYKEPMELRARVVHKEPRVHRVNRVLRGLRDRSVVSRLEVPAMQARQEEVRMTRFQ